MTELKQHFVNLTPGKMMGLRRITDKNGCFRVLALDQSNSFRKALRRTHEIRDIPGEPTYEEISAAKLEFSRIIGANASAVLLDVNYGLRQAINANAIPKGTGLLGRVEASKDAGTPVEFEPGWSVGQIKQMGADAVKLLVYLDMGNEQATEHQLDFARQIQKDCRENDILLLIEELSYKRPGESDEDYAGRKVQNTIDSARALGPITDILKLEFPGDINTLSASEIQDNLLQLNEVAIRPWVLLSAGVDFDLFEKQTELAMKAGSSGIMAGRAIFKEWFTQNTAQESARFTEHVGRPRFQKLCDIVANYATSWQQRLGISDQELRDAVSADWYKGGKVYSEVTSSGDY
ncbi:MAG: tagatose 1,6-diphosphate aldolase [Armatimonadetes bacterium]|nr:tagatose 1,6-diphosphate aldolase [Armatimonadota bacterium]